MLNADIFRMIKPVIKAKSNMSAAEKVSASVKSLGVTTANEIITDTELRSGTVYRTLDKLITEGVITKVVNVTGISGNPALYKEAVSC